jgi:magnesium transporter
MALPLDEDRPLGALLAPDILELLDESPASVPAETEELHAADLAAVAEALPRDRLAEFVRALPRDRGAELLEFLDEDVRAELLEAMSAPEAAQLVQRMAPDERADILDEVDAETADEILDAIPAEARRVTEQLLAYDPESAGGLMTTEFVAVPAAATVEDALARVREMARSPRREAMHTVYAVDADGALTGVLSLRELLAAPPGAAVSEIAWSEVQHVVASADRSEVVRKTSDYGLVAIPVVDDRKRLLGVVTVDDVIEVIQEEQTESVQRFGGLEALDLPYTQTAFSEMIRKRVVWLAVLFLGGTFTAAAMSAFSDELQRAVVLSLFIPLIIASGGNSGSQATSLIIRALAMGELRTRDWWRVALRELPIAASLGAILGVIGVLRVLLWQWFGWFDHGPEYVRLAWTVGASLVGVVTVGSLVGAVLPFILRRFGLDPATASAPFVATVVDVTGIAIYFTVALLLLRGTLL